jgi:hypothetical protein
MFIAMSDFTLSQIEAGDPQAAAKLLPLVYEWLAWRGDRPDGYERRLKVLPGFALIEAAGDRVTCFFAPPISIVVADENREGG